MISLSMRGFTATLAIGVTLPSRSMRTGTFFLTACATSTVTAAALPLPFGSLRNRALRGPIAAHGGKAAREGQRRSHPNQQDPSVHTYVGPALRRVS